MDNKYMMEIIQAIVNPKYQDRTPGSKAHQKSKVYIANQLKQNNFKALDNLRGFYQDIYDKDNNIVGTNIVGMLPGNSDKYILLISHYDTVKECPGANDNGAAIAIMLNTIKSIGRWKGDLNIIMLVSDLEEPPHFQQDTMGSSYFYNNCPIDKDKIICAIVLDLVGSDVPLERIKDALFVMGAEYSESLMDIVQGAREKTPNISVYPALNHVVGNMSDHHIFEINNKPFLFLSCGRNRHYHQTTDTIKHLNFEKMFHISEYLKHLILLVDNNHNSKDQYRKSNFPCNRFLTLASHHYSDILGKDIKACEKEVYSATIEIMKEIEAEIIK